MIVFLNFYARFESIKRIVKSISRMILFSYIIILVTITYVNKLLTNRDLLFKL